MKRAWFLAGVLLGGALAADPAPAAVPGLPLLPLLPGMPMLPMPPLSPMPPSGFFSALPFLSLAGRGRGGGMMGPYGAAPSGYASSLAGGGPAPAAGGEVDEAAFKKAAYLSGLTSGPQYRGTRDGVSLKRYYANQPTAMPGLIVPFGALRAMNLVR